MAKDNDLGDFAAIVPPKEGDLGDFASIVPKKQNELLRIGSDALVSLGKGAIAVPEALVGLADIPTGGAIGRLAAEAGFTPKQWQENIASHYSPEFQQQQAEVQQAEGFLGKVGAAIQRPAVIGNAVVESIPGTLAGGAIGRGLKVLGVGEHIATGLGEGAISAGQTAEQIRQDDPTGSLTAGQGAIAAGSGLLTAGIGGVSSKVAKQFGVQTAENMLVSGLQREVPKGMLARTAAGAAIEGGLEELPQSAQEQIAQNLAQGKPLDEGVGNAAAMGLVTGAAMGAGVNLPGPLTKAAALRQEEERVKNMPFKNEEAAQARANDLTTKNPGQQFEIVPHPTVGGAFAVVPVKESEDGAGRSGTAAGTANSVATSVPAGHDAATEFAAGAGAGDATGAGAVVAESAAGGTPEVDRSAAESGGAGHDVGSRAIEPNAGPMTRAAALAPGVSIDTPSATAPEEPPFTNIGAAKVDVGNLRMESDLDRAAHEAANSPLNARTLASIPQQDANNAKLGHTEYVNGDVTIPIRIENPQGSVRQSRPDAETPWRSLMTEHYGYIPSTKGADGDPVDVYAGNGNKIFVIDQAAPDGKFDEHKVMLGFGSAEQARQAYYDNYQQGWRGGDAMTEVSAQGLRAWLDKGNTQVPFNPTLFAQTSSTLSQSTANAAPPAAAGSNAVASHSAPALASSASLPGADQPTDLSTAPSQPGSMPATASAGSAPGVLPSSLAATSVAGSGLAAPTGDLHADAGGPVVSLSSPDKEPDAKHTAESSQLGSVSSKSSIPATELPQGTKAESPVVQQAVAAQVLPKVLPTKVPVFRSIAQAQAFATEQQLDAEPVAHPNGGIVLRPKVTPTTPAQRADDTARVTQLNRALKQDDVQVKAVHDISPAQHTIRAIVQRAFGTRVVYVTDNPEFDGVHHHGTAFVNASVKEATALVHVTFHELMHVLQAANRKLANQLYRFTKSYMQGGLVEGRIDAETQAAQKSKPGQPVAKLTKQQGIDEAMADISGALALDPKFWKAMAKHDDSLFRKVAYKFMQMLTKLITVAQGSRFDIDQMVTDRAAVREAIAKGWAEYNRSRKETTDGQPALSRKGASSADRQPAEARGLQEPGRVRGSARVLARSSGPDSRDAPLAGLPTPVAVDGRLTAFGPFLPARDAAERYMAQAGLPYRRQTAYAKLDPERGRAIAAEFDAMKHDPQDPKVKAAYAAMIRETLAQYQEIKKTGLKIEFIDYAKTGDPYGNPRNAILDVVNHNHLWVFSTRDGFGGPNATLDVSDNPLLAATDETISGQVALVNDIFRVVHDYFGHIKEGIGFRAEGEENAWQQHVRMYSDAAIPAMTSETRGQNSWVNFGPYGAANRNAASDQTEYATQKIGLMPEWTYTQGRQFQRKLENASHAEAAFQLAERNTFATNREFKLALQEQVRAAAKASNTDPTDPAYLQRVALADAQWAIAHNANAVGWYDDKVTKALTVLSLIHPEIATDRQAKFAFVWALAVTSNGNTVDKNFEQAEQAYRYYQQHGALPTDIGIGKAKHATNAGLSTFNDLMALWGFETLERFMTTKQTVRAIQQATGYKINGESMDNTVFGAAILGPKVGNGYFANLYGYFDQLTMDRWFMRTWGRWTGNLVKVDRDRIKSNTALFKSVVNQMDADERRAFGMIIGTRVTGTPAKVADAILNAAQKPAKRDRMQALPHGELLRLAGNNLARTIDGQIEAPQNASQRNQIRAVMQAALKELQPRYPALTMADLQALLWYPEKRLYDAAKAGDRIEAGYDDRAAPDYANAAVKLARRLGVAEDRINDALRKDDGTTGRATRTGRGSAEGRATAQAEARQYSRSGLDEPADRSSDAGDRRSGALALRPQQADAVAPVAVTHYGQAGDLATLDASHYGSGLKGAEANRLRYSQDQSIKQRVYFYLTPDDGALPKKEAGLGPHVYTATLGNLYDFSKDPAGILPKIREIRDSDDKNNTMESLIVQAGYDGYLVRAYNMAVVLGMNVPVSYQGTDTPQHSRKMPDDLAQVPGMTPELAAKAGAFVPGQTFRQRWDGFRNNFAQRWIQGMVDVFHPLKELNWHAYMLARMASSADGAVESILEFGKLTVDGSGALQNDRTGGLKQLLGQLQGEQSRFFTWVVGNRADMLMQQRRENLFTAPEIAIMKAANQGTMPDGTSRALFYARMNRELQAFNKNVLDVAEQMGVIDAASRPRWEHDFYIPFYRLAEGDDAFMPTQVSGLTNVKGIVKLKGGTANLGDPLQNLVLNWAYLVSASLKNQAATFALREAEQIGAAHAVPAGTKDAIFILDNGRKEYFTVDDPFLLTAISSIRFTGIKGVVIDAAGFMKRALSFGVTINPSYMLRNLIRDQLQAPAANPVSFNIMQNLVDGIKASAHDSPLYAQSLTSGGQYRMGVAYEGNRAAELKRAIAKIDQSTLLDTEDKVKHFLANVLDQYLEVGARAESITRSAIYAQALADGKSALEAAFAARDSMDFGLQGAWPAVRILAQTVPFFNARVQGLYKLGRAAADDPKRFAIQLGAVTAATLALMLAYRDDDDWKQREEWDRDNFWWFKVGSQAFRIPKPFEIGALASIAERGLELTLDGLDAKTAKRFGTRVERILLDNLSMNLTPQLIKPALDVYANTDPFRNRPIELPYEQESLTPSERIGAQTTALAQLLGKADLLSPKQLDYLIQGYFGWLGGHLALATDFALRPALGLPEKPTRRLEDTFLLGEWVKELPARESRFMSEFYQQAKDVKQAMGDFNHAKALGNVDKAKELLESNRAQLQQAPKFNFAATRLANINRQIRKIEASALEPDAKRARIDQLTSLRNQLAERVMTR